MRVIQLVMTGAPVQLLVPSAQNPQGNVAASLMMVQANTANATIGDNTVTATKGIVLTAGTVYPFDFSAVRGSLLSQYWFFGTSSDTVTVLYETAQ
jgi:hypothetical protein